MVDFLRLVWCLVTGLFRSRAALQAEILVLRHQVNVLRRKTPKRLVFSNIDRLVFAGLYGLMPNARNALKILQPATVIAWHRAGFRAYWRWKSRPRGGRPQASPEVRGLIHEMSIANPLWGAPRIHGELLKLGINVGQTTVAKYMVTKRRPPSQGWKTFLRNHADGIVAMDMFVVPTVSFRLLYGLLILQHARRGATVVGGNSPSVRPMGRTAIDRSVRLEGRTAIPYSRPRLCLWGRLHSACWGYGHSRPTGLGALAMAERIRGEADWLDPAGLS